MTAPRRTDVSQIDPTDQQRFSGPVKRQSKPNADIESTMTTIRTHPADPWCWLCPRPLDWTEPAVWRDVTTARGAAIYRPCCDHHDDTPAAAQPAAECEVCSRPVSHTHARDFPYYVCCFPHLDAARLRNPPPPPEPRPCEHCDTIFTPRRRRDARFCSQRCGTAAWHARQRLTRS